MEQMDMTYFLISNEGANINIIAQNVGMTIDASLIQLSMGAMLKTQLEGQIPGIVFVNEGEVVRMGEHEYFQMEYSYELSSDTTMTVIQDYISCNENLLIFTYTSGVAGNISDTDRDILAQVLGSLEY